MVHARTERARARPREPAGQRVALGDDGAERRSDSPMLLLPIYRERRFSRPCVGRDPRTVCKGREKSRGRATRP
eukprot:456980-Prymnesium_polylepis.1